MQKVIVGLLLLNFVIVVALLLRRHDSPALNEERIVGGLRDEFQRSTTESRSLTQEWHKGVIEQLDRSSKAVSENLREERRDLNERVDRFSTTLQETGLEARREASEARASLEQSLEASLAKMTDGLKEFRESNEKQLIAIAEKVDSELNRVRESNEKKLDEMRETVDEKLHGALEKRLGESFKLVSDRLDAVHKGLGEMQQLASGVGDLKRVLTNVKSRGVWGEVQLGRQLEDLLTIDQYEQNVAVKPGSGERVE